MLLGLGGTVRYSSPGAKFFFAFSTYLFITAWLYTTLQHLNFPRLLSIVTWFSGISLAFVIVLFSPMFLSLSLLCIVSTVLHGISLENIHRNEIFIGSVITLTSVAGVAALTEWSYFNGYIFDFQLFDAAGRDLERLLNAAGAYQLAAQANMIVESAFRIPLLIGFSVNILQMLWRFYIRIESNIARMQRTNADLTTAQQDLQQRLYERTQLLEVSRSVSSTQDFSSLLSNTLIQLKTVVDYGRATVLLVRDDQLEEISSAGHLPNLSTEGLAPVVLSKTNLTSLSDLRDVVLLETDLSWGIDGSNLIVPLVVRGRLIGLLAIRHEHADFYDRHEADLCMAFANQVAGIIDSAQLQQAATDALINAERSRLARELHDSVSQSLFGIVLGTRTALEQIGPSPEAARTALLYSVDLAASALAEMRALILTMRPETLEKYGLVIALQNQIDLLRPHHPARIRFVSDAAEAAEITEPDVSLDTKEALYRITVEALHNAIRHAKCSSVLIRLSHDSQQICVEISDDGRGFDPTVDYTGHLGLKTMRERATALDGTLSIESTADEGTRVLATLPKNIKGIGARRDLPLSSSPLSPAPLPLAHA